ncbi:MAG: PAS domain S-box protein [Chloroflexi bacterium]|nr:PAS domain S-box protein [Chloroflexota bacterium]
MPIALIVWDVDFRVQSWNPAAENIFGFSNQEVLGKHPYGLVMPKEAQPHVDTIWDRLLEGDMTAHSINENVTKDGRTIICRWTNTPLRKADGTVMGVLSMVQDIAERKRAEMKVKKLYTLQSAIKEINELLLRARSEQELFREICHHLTTADFVRFAWIGLLQEGTTEIKSVAHAGFEDEFLSIVEVTMDEMDLGTGPRGITLKTHKPVIINDIEKNPSYDPWWEEALKRGYAALAAMPLVRDSEVIGILCISSGTGDAFGDE